MHRLSSVRTIFYTSWRSKESGVACRFAASRKIVTLVTANTLPSCKSKARDLTASWGTHQKLYGRLIYLLSFGLGRAEISIASMPDRPPA
jgi:hypothetical protein